MVTSYGLEHKSPVFIAIFSFGCVLAATYAFLLESIPTYAFLLESIPFLIAEGAWAMITFRRWLVTLLELLA